LEAPIAGVPAVFAEGQGGLLDLALHPNFSQNQWLYMTYAAGDSESNYTVVARARLEGAALVGHEVLYQVRPGKPGGQHFGARMAFTAYAHLLVSIGDGGNPPAELNGEFIRENAQKLSNAFGKILRLNDDGSIPTDNPWVGKVDHDPAVFSYGHRNIQGLAVDRKTDAVYATEHGALGGDELNRITPGGNYGWPKVSYSREYVGGDQVGSGKRDAKYLDPMLVWEVATAPSGLMVYRGKAFPDWRGRIFSGSLVKQDVRVIALKADGTLKSEQALRFAARVRDVREGPDGLIYVLTDEKGGRLFKLEPAD